MQLSVCIARYFITIRGRPRAPRSLLQWKDLPPGRAELLNHASFEQMYNAEAPRQATFDDSFGGDFEDEPEQPASPDGVGILVWDLRITCSVNNLVLLVLLVKSY